LQDHEFKDFIERVKLGAAIEEVVRTRVTSLKRAGHLWVACCPFHGEKTPSFKVDPSRGTWRCYGACGEGGDSISFIMKTDNAEFMEALKATAEISGVPWPENGFGRKGNKKEDARFQKIYDVLERAEKVYKSFLLGPEGQRARQYLEDRGLGAETASVFGVGWAPGGGSPLFDKARQAGIPENLMMDAGLVRRRDDGACYDFFYNRIMIPIRDPKGRTVGFGARALDDLGGKPKGPKYVNTPETPLFHKGRLIYGYDLSMPAIRKEKRVILVEGYTDVMAAHQAGHRTVCAVLGTATTSDHAALIRRSGARRATLVFDGDEAGARATRKALMGLLPLEIDIDVAAPPAGEDPCDLLVRDGGKPFEKLVSEPVGWLEFLLGRMQDLDPKELSEAVNELLEVLFVIPKPVHASALIRPIASGLGLPEEDVRSQYDELKRRRAPRKRELQPPSSRPSAASFAAPSQGGSPGGFAEEPYFPAGEPDAGGGYGQEQGFPSFPSGETEAIPYQISSPAQSGQDRFQVKREENERLAYRQLLGAMLRDNGLIPIYLPATEDETFVNCPETAILDVVQAVRALYYEGPDDADIDSAAIAASLPAEADQALPAQLEALADFGDAAELARDSLKYIQEQDHRRTVETVRLNMAQAKSEDERARYLVELSEATRKLHTLQPKH
jgi:DNA primase